MEMENPEIVKSFTYTLKDTMSMLSLIKDSKMQCDYNMTITPRDGVDMLRILQFLELAHSEQAFMPQGVELCPAYLRSSCCFHL